jgi:S-methylmethionine-dependent homocysteine/selenocysteine methylase
MNWKDTLIKSEDITWKNPKIKNLKDGRIDFILTIPLTNIVEMQARLSFLKAIREYHFFMIDNAKLPLEEFNTKLKEKLVEWGFNVNEEVSNDA